MNRLSRDQIIGRGLDAADSPSLDFKERPSGTILSTAMSIGWLQDALDLWHNRFPWAGIVKTAALTISTDTVALPADFILDVRDGLLLPDKKQRLIRWSLGRFIRASISPPSPATPARYVILPPNLRVIPAPDIAYAATLWYYALPAVLAAGTIPNFPSDWVLSEYIRLRANEWLDKAPAGTALAYAEARIAELRSSGLANEPEETEVQVDRERYGPRGGMPWDWLGNPVIG